MWERAAAAIGSLSPASSSSFQRYLSIEHPLPWPGIYWENLETKFLEIIQALPGQVP